jgi:uroporphyrinogen decarboxylase
MTKRERVAAALRGDAVDRVPLAFWAHNFLTENSAKTLAAETLRLAREFDWDYLKPQSRAQCFAETWGLEYKPSGARATQYTVTRVPLRDASDFARLAPADPRTGALGEQLEALRLIRDGVGRDTPIIWTVFAPLMVAPYLLPRGREQMLEIMRSSPDALEHALGAIAETLAAYAKLAIESGADGLFYATNVATEASMSAAECRRFQRPFDLRVLSAVASASFNLMHVCGERVLFDEFVDYPVTAFSWATNVPGNPSLGEGHRRAGRAVVGGLPAKPVIKAMTNDAIAERTRAAIRETGGRWLLLGPDCSIDPDTPDALLRAARAAIEEA